MDNIWYIILDYTDDPFVYKYTYLASALCKRNYKQDKIKEFSNHLSILLKLFPNENWNWKKLSANSAVTWNMLELNYPWCSKRISARPDLTEDIITKFNIKWNWTVIYTNPKIPLDFRIEIKKNININDKKRDFFFYKNNRRYRTRMNWIRYHLNNKLNWEEIKAHPNKSWNWEMISRNSDITCEIVENNLDYNWNWQYLSKNKNITWEFIVKYKDKNWDFDKMSCNTFGCKFKN